MRFAHSLSPVLLITLMVIGLIKGQCNVIVSISGFISHNQFIRLNQVPSMQLNDKDNKILLIDLYTTSVHGHIGM